MLLESQIKPMLRIVAVILLLASGSISAATVVAEPVPCEEENAANGKVYSVKGKGVNLRLGPGRSFDRVRDEDNKLAKLDAGYIVRENCRTGEWSQINLLSPDWLRKSHRGWVHSSFLAH